MYNNGQDWIHMNNRELPDYLRTVLEVLESEPANAEEIYGKWLTAGNQGTFQEVLGSLTDLELMDLCKCHKNLFSIH